MKISVKGEPYTGNPANNPLTFIPWPKMHQFKSGTAWAADYLPPYPGYLTRHPEGVNVLYFDGSVLWVPTAAFKTNYAASISNVLLMNNVWTDFDKYHR